MSATAHTIFFREGNHICLFYRSVEEQFETLIAFIKIGLNRNERCFCVVPEDRVQQLVARLETAGIDTNKEVGPAKTRRDTG